MAYIVVLAFYGIYMFKPRTEVSLLSGKEKSQKILQIQEKPI